MDHLQLSVVLLQAQEPGIIMQIVITAIAFLAGSFILPSVEVKSVITALVLAIVISVLNSTLGAFIKLIGFPFKIITLGLFPIIVNALMIKLTDFFLKGFKVKGFLNAILLAIIVVVVNNLLERILF